MSHSDEDCFGKRTNQKTINDVLGGPMESRAESMKQYNKYESKRKKDIKALKKQNKMLFIISKKSGSYRELKKIKNIRAKSAKKRRNDSSNSSSDGLDSDSSLASDCG